VNHRGGWKGTYHSGYEQTEEGVTALLVYLPSGGRGEGVRRQRRSGDDKILTNPHN